MYRARMLCSVPLLAVVAVAAPHLATAQVNGAEGIETLCEVSAEQIIAATSQQLVLLDTQACSMNFAYMVDLTMGRMRKSYAAFYEQLALNPNEVREISRLLTRRELLRDGWSFGRVGYSAAGKSSAVLQGVDARLREHLVPQQIAALKQYDETLAARVLTAPVVARLNRAGRPWPDDQRETAIREIQRVIAEWNTNYKRETHANLIDRCSASHAQMNERDDRIQDVMLRSLDEEQRQIAQAYYRDLFAKRAKSFERYRTNLETANPGLCAIDVL